MIRRPVALVCAFAVAILGSLASAQGSNRLWVGRLELSGPLAAVELDCGARGVTRIEAVLRAGERRVIDVPVPWAPPLGLDGLRHEPAPAIRVEGGPPENATWLGPAERQPEEGWAKVPVAMRLRARPPAPAREDRGVPVSALLVVLGVEVAALGVLRRRERRRALTMNASAALLLVAGAIGGAWITVSETTADGTTLLLDVDVSRTADGTILGSTGLVVTAGGSVELAPSDPGLRIEVQPSDAAIDYLVDLDARRWRVRGPAGVVSIRRVELAVTWPAEAAPAWWREPSGGWTRLGAIATEGKDGEYRGTPEAGGDPPGWLVAGLPPGRGVLVARLARDPLSGAPGVSGAWMRVVGARSPTAR